MSAMAEINKAKKAVDDARKEAVRRVSEPIRAFEAQIKEVCGIFDSAYAELGNQVKAFEDKQRDEKRKAVFALIEQELEANQITMKIPVRNTWLNKTASTKTIREEVTAIIEKEIENRRAAQERKQVKQDRAAAIESHVVNLNRLHGFSFPVSRFISGQNLDLYAPLGTVLSGISSFFEQEKAKESKRKAEAAAIVSPVNDNQKPVTESAKVEAQQAPPSRTETRAMAVVFEYNDAYEGQVQDCLGYLKKLCVNFAVRLR